MRAAFFAIAALAIAHHSHPIFYDACTSVTLEPPTKPVVDIVQVRGVNDNWSWARTEPATAPDCGRK